MGEALKYYGRRRSIVRRIGSLLPLKPHPKIYVSVTPLHSMTSSMINEESSNDLPGSNRLGSGRFVYFYILIREGIRFIQNFTPPVFHQISTF